MRRGSWLTWLRGLGALVLGAAMAWGATNDFLPTTGDWNTAGNWSLGHAPLITDDVTIGAGKAVTVAITTTPLALNARSIAIAATGTLALSSGATGDFIELTIATDLTINGQMIVGGGANGVGAQLICTSAAPQIGGSGTLAFGDSTANGILLQANADLAIGGTLTVSGNAWTIDQSTPADGTALSAVATIGNGATVSIPSGTLRLSNGLNLTNNGILVLGAGASILFDGNGYADLTQSASGRLDWTINGSGLSAVLLPYSVHLGGTLNLIRPSAYFPSRGDAFALLNLVQSNIVGNFTSFLGTSDFTNDFVPPSRSYGFSFALDLQTISWSQILGLQPVNGPDVDLTAMSDASSSVNQVTYTVALASGGTASSTIIPSPGPGVRARLHPGATPETIIVTAHAARTGSYDDAMAISSAPFLIADPATVAIATPIGGFTYGDVLAATATPSSTITWSTTNPAVVAITNGGTTARIIGIGTATVTATAAATSSHAAGSASLALGTINPKTVIVTVANQSRAMGAANPANSFTVSGLVAGDTAASLGAPTYTGSGTTADATTPPGTYPLTVSFPANAKYSVTYGPPANLTILQPQNITFAALANLLLSSPTRALGASASSGLAITYASSDPAVATVDNATGTVTAVAVGSAIITATQAGDATYAAANPVAQTLLVIDPQPQAISFQLNGGAPWSLPITSEFDLVGSSTSGLPLTYTASDPTVLGIVGSHVTALALGTATITATQAGDNDFLPAIPVISSLVTVIPRPQTITWTQTIGMQPVNGADIPLTALSDADSSVTYVTYTVALAGGGTAASTIIPSSGPGVRAQLHPGPVSETIIITAHAAATGLFGPAPAVSLPAIIITTPAIVDIAVPPGGFTYGDVLVATATPSAAITWSSSDATVVAITNDGATATIVGMGSASVTAVAAATSSHLPGSATLALGTINPKPVIVTVANQARYVGQSNPPNAFTVSGLVNGDLPAVLGTPTYGGSGTTADATTPVGSYPLTVSFPANPTYLISFGAAASLTISPQPQLPQTITFPPLAYLPLQQPTRALGASASSGLPIIYTSSDTAVATVNNATGEVTAVAVGTVDITATQPGNATNAPAAPVTQSLLVTNPVAQTITFQINGGGITEVFVGDGLTLAGTSTSGLALSYASSDPTIATIAGDRLTAVATGSLYVTATQAGNAYYLPAQAVISSQVRVIPRPAGTTTGEALADGGGGGGCGMGGGVAVVLAGLALAWRRRTLM